MADQEFIICGAGAVGSNLVENMARQGFKKFTIVDFDRVDDHNRHTQAYDRRDVGQFKVNALKSRIFNVMGISLEIVGKKLDEVSAKKLFKKGAIVVDGFDNVESRKMVTECCTSLGVTCLHVGLNKDYAEICWNQFYRVPDKVKGMDVCEYPLARNIAMMAGVVATEVIIHFLEKGEYKNFAITLGDMKINAM